MTAFDRTALAAAGATLLILGAAAGCGSDDTSVGPSGRGVHVETGTSVHATVGVDGDTLTARGADGATFTFGVPALALNGSTTITVTPVRAVTGGPLADAAVVAAVRLEPSGLAFARPAELTIGLPAGVDPSRLTGFVSDGDGERPHLVPVRVDGQTVTLLVPHFSVAGVVVDASAIPEPPASAGAALFEHRAAAYLAALAGQPPQYMPLATIFQEWYDLVVRPAAQRAALPSATDTTLHAALAEYSRWVRSWSNTGTAHGLFDRLESVFEPERAEMQRQFLPPGFKAAVARNNQRCLAEGSANTAALRAANNALYWREQAHGTAYLNAQGQLELDPALRLGDVLAQLCVQVVYDEVRFPEQLQAGQTAELGVRVGRSAAGRPPQFSPFMRVEVQPVNATAAAGQSLVGSTTTDGAFATQLAVQQTPVVVNVHSCVNRPDMSFAHLICKDTLLAQGSGGVVVMRSESSIVSAGVLGGAYDVATSDPGSTAPFDASASKSTTYTVTDNGGQRITFTVSGSARYRRTFTMGPGAGELRALAGEGNASASAQAFGPESDANASGSAGARTDLEFEVTRAPTTVELRGTCSGDFGASLSSAAGYVFEVARGGGDRMTPCGSFTEAVTLPPGRYFLLVGGHATATADLYPGPPYPASASKSSSYSYVFTVRQ